MPDVTVTANLEQVLIDDTELAVWQPGAGLADRAHAFWQQQRATWDEARQGYAALAAVQERTIDLDGFPVRVQYNPGRLVSSSARVDARSIGARPCFLCSANLPAGQRAILLDHGRLLLVNPFPIFPEHFTLPTLAHRPQRLGESLTELLDLARDLAPRYTVLYNGPRCGASAPDHHHFQAGTAGFLPLDARLEVLRATHGESLGSRDGVDVAILDRLPSRGVLLEGDDRSALAGRLAQLLGLLVGLVPDDPEPMVNVIALHRGRWRILVIPRVRHRPSCYAVDSGLLLSPGSVDLGGVCITPREEDYQRVDRGVLEAVFSEVCLSAEGLARLKEGLARGGPGAESGGPGVIRALPGCSMDGSGPARAPGCLDPAAGPGIAEPPRRTSHEHEVE